MCQNGYEMRKKRVLNYNIIYALLAVVGIVVTIIASLNPYERDVHMVRNGARSYDTDWEYKNNRINTYDVCSLPLKLDRNAYQDMTV